MANKGRCPQIIALNKGPKTGGWRSGLRMTIPMFKKSFKLQDTRFKKSLESWTLPIAFKKFSWFLVLLFQTSAPRPLEAVFCRLLRYLSASSGVVSRVLRFRRNIDLSICYLVRSHCVFRQFRRISSQLVIGIFIATKQTKTIWNADSMFSG